MARKRDRVFALTLAIVFFITAFGFSFWVIWEVVNGNTSTSDDVSQASQTPQTPTASSSCQTDTATEAVLPIPAVYTTSATITSLQTTDLTVGTGAAAKNGDCLVMKYYGTIAPSGQEFDENFDKTTGFEFVLGAGSVIKGWDQGLVDMKVGGERRLVIPSSLGYGDQASGSIPANSTLVFVVKLLRIQ